MGQSQPQERIQALYSYGNKRCAVPKIPIDHDMSDIKSLNVIAEERFIITDSNNKFWVIGSHANGVNLHGMGEQSYDIKK